MLTHEAFINVLKTRYDHYSSPIMAKEIFESAGLEQKDQYDKAEVEKILETVNGMGDPRSEVIVAQLEELLGGGDKKDDKKAEAKKDDKKEEKAEAKKDDKKDDKKADAKKGGKKK